MRSFFVGLLSLLCALAVSLLLWVITLHATILQRDVTKGWLGETQLYAQLVPTLTKNIEIPENNLIPTATAEQALNKTFTPDYVKQQSEAIIDKAYDWLEGKTPTLSFSLSIDEKRPALIDQLAAALEPQIANLPVCTTEAQLAAQDGSCRPPNMTPAALSQHVATEAVTQFGLFNKPLTNQDLSQRASNQPLNLPAIAEVLRQLLMILPVGIVIGIGLITLIAADRLRAFRQLGRRVFLTSLLTLIVAALVWQFSSSLPISQDNAAVALATPVIAKALSAIGLQLLLLSGVAVILSGGVWLLAAIIVRRRHPTPLKPAAPTDLSLATTTQPPSVSEKKQ